MAEVSGGRARFSCSAVEALDRSSQQVVLLTTRHGSASSCSRTRGGAIGPRSGVAIGTSYTSMPISAREGTAPARGKFSHLLD